MINLFKIFGLSRNPVASGNAPVQPSAFSFSETMNVLESLPKTSGFSGKNLKELALILARPDLKPAAVSITSQVYSGTENILSSDSAYRKVQQIVLPVPFAIERAIFYPTDYHVQREFLIATPVIQKEAPNLPAKKNWEITNESKSTLKLSPDLYYDVNPYWKEYARYEMRNDFKSNPVPCEELVIYIANTEDKLDKLLALRETGYSQKEDLQRGEALGIPKEVAAEFCSLSLQQQVIENNRIADAVDDGILPASMSNLWWWTTMNCLKRPDELRMISEIDDFYKELERAASPDLLKQLKD